jgi:hypothetical protein
MQRTKKKQGPGYGLGIAFSRQIGKITLWSNNVRHSNSKDIITIKLKKIFINPHDVCQSVIIDKILNCC